MKELLKNKVMLGFVIFIFGIIYINSINISSDAKMIERSDYEQIIYNK